MVSTVLLIQFEPINSFIYFQSNPVKLNFHSSVREADTPMKAASASPPTYSRHSAIGRANTQEREKQPVEDPEKSTANQTSNYNDTEAPGNLLLSRFNYEKWEEQKRMSERIHFVCISLLVVIVITGTAALAYIIRVTLLAREMFKSREVTHRFQPTADNMRTVDEVIDQFKTNFQTSVDKPVQPLNIPGMNQ
ncbi:hypothetical protein Y032_0149g2701 [Ancylostoma ceylanicum]|nr:hypothetical protein Y032_0149g2701 [Ancylostoma ceylanicum]